MISEGKTIWKVGCEGLQHLSKRRIVEVRIRSQAVAAGAEIFWEGKKNEIHFLTATKIILKRIKSLKDLLVAHFYIGSLLGPE